MKISRLHVLNDFGPDLQDFTAYSVEAKLENLSEGNHTVTAYASDMSISRIFTVNSHYQVTIIKIFSPVNQTYSKTVPLVFAVNGEVKEAHYYMYRTFLWRRYEAVYEKHFDGNITLDNLYDGNYIMHLYVTTELGEAVTTAYFTVSNSEIPSSQTSTTDQTTEPAPSETSNSNSQVTPQQWQYVAILSVTIVVIVVVAVLWSTSRNANTKTFPLPPFLTTINYY